MSHKVRKFLPVFLGVAVFAVLIGMSLDPIQYDINTDTWNMQGAWYSQDAPDGIQQAPQAQQHSPPPQPVPSQSAYQSTLESYTESTHADSMAVGFAVGGAQDVGNFRTNIENDFLPLYTDITYEGLFYDYYFETANTHKCDKLFCPSYSSAVSRDPLSEKDEYFLSVGLNSGIKDFERKKLNLVLVLDVSGSMSSQFDLYHYDGKSATLGESGSDHTKSKMQVATESIVGLLDHLTDDDRLGVVLFDDSAHLARPLTGMENTDRETLKKNVLKIYPDGGTNMASGIRLGTELFERVPESDRFEYESRIIFLTDAMPNMGETRQGGLFDMISKNAERRIYTTVIGIGVDFNTELIEHITKVRGANYYSVHSLPDFKERMGDEFEYMVTPLVFDLALNLESDGYEIKSVYGSPESAQATGEIMRVNTLFPSKILDDETKGGIILVKLEKISDNATITLSTSYEDRRGNKGGDAMTVEFDDDADYNNTGIHKGVLLARYAELIKTWIYDERGALAGGGTPDPAYLYEYGIHAPDRAGESLGRWERQSVPLAVSESYGSAISEFNAYFEREAILIGDPALRQEIKIMQKLESLA